MKHTLLAFGIILGTYCADSKKPIIKSIKTKNDTTVTCVVASLNISTNEYRHITAQRIIKDTFLPTIVDSSGGRIIQELKLTRDTSYFAWWPVAVPDSTGKTRKNFLGTDSVIFRLVPMEKNIIIHDYNKKF